MATVSGLDKYVVTTKRFVDRQILFDSTNSHISNYEWSYGPDAREYKTIEIIREELSDKISPDIPWSSSLVCNALSHYSLLEECARGTKIITIMEDDAVLVKDFDNRALSLINSLPEGDFDLIQWGWNWDSLMFVRDANGGVVKINWFNKYLKVDPIDFRDTKAPSTLMPLLLTFGIHCYSITPQGAQKLLDLYPVIKNIWVDSLGLTGIAYRAETIDGAFNAFYPQLKAFAAIAPLSFVTNDKKDSLLWTV